MENYIQFIMQHWMLTGAWLVVGFVLLGQLLYSQGGKQLTPQGVTLLLNHSKAKLIDIRPTDQFAQGHIAQALNFPPEQANAQNLDKFRDKTLIIVCQNGQKSTALVRQLRKQGFSDMVILREGMRAWQQAKLPLER